MSTFSRGCTLSFWECKDNGKMESTLKMLKMRATVTRLEEAIQKPMIMRGVRVTTELKLEQARVHGGGSGYRTGFGHGNEG